MNKTHGWKRIHYDDLPKELSEELNYIGKHNSDNEIQYVFGWQHYKTKNIIFVTRYYMRGISRSGWGYDIELFDNGNKEITDIDEVYSMAEAKSLAYMYMKNLYLTI